MRVPCKLQVPRRYANTFPYVSGAGQEDEGEGTKGHNEN